MIDELTLVKVLKNAILGVSNSDLFTKEADLQDQGIIHSKRSSQFVEQLRQAFIPCFSDESIHVLAKTKKAEFANRSEFLFDVIVVKTTPTQSPFSGRSVNVITECLLQVESEFALDFNQAMIDFSKLLCGLAPIKMMVMPFFKNDQTINDWLQENIFTRQRRQTDNAIYYLAYIKHPKHWKQNEASYFELYKCEGEEIVEVKQTRAMVKE